MRFAEVSVNSPIARRQTFSYSIPQGLDITTGHAVWVPFGERVLQGIVTALSPYPAVEETREIIGTIEPAPLLTPNQLELARWISDYYLAPLFASIALMLPPGFERKAIIWLRAPETSDIMSSLPSDQQEVLDLIHRQGRLSLKELKKRFGKKKVQNLVSPLVKKNLLVRDFTLEPVRVSARKETCLSLAINEEEARVAAAELRQKRALRQAAVLEFLLGKSQVRLAEAREQTGATRSIINALAGKRLVTTPQVPVKRQPLLPLQAAFSLPLKLTPAQEAVSRQITETLQPGKPAVFLLHGVTGSGKTEIYLQALAETVKRGKKGVVLVPEIALTPQTIERFAARFPGKVAVLHSGLSLGEQFDEWHRIRNGECDVVIGARSAIFAPQPDLGLIVIDEEHGWNYKQDDIAPRYHARSVALRLAELTGAVVILGSATPDVETYYHAQKRDYHLWQLPERVIATATMPQVEVVDMRSELKAGNRSIFSRTLVQEIRRTLANNEQVILFLNRRGAATFIQCRNCGFSLRCRRCDTSLTYHPVENMLICHQCHYRTPVPDVCPHCHQPQLKFLGLGTQKLEKETEVAFPEAKQLRWDSDATKGKNSHEQILCKFRNHEADILIGTQMVAKGLDLPSITLVGVVSADTALNLPDFRSAERTFQLLSQVAGRAGRGGLPGRVILQTFSPQNYAIQAAARHDYPAFYRQEIEYRRELHNPPFTQLASLVYLHTNESACRREAERMKKQLIIEKEKRGIAGMSIIGPAPAFIQRRRGRYRWQMVLRSTKLADFLADISLPQGWLTDIDPVSLI
ncbi:primosomal protein N' [Chloroflexota bacterium]